MEPSSLLAQEYSVALMRVALGVFWGSTGEVGYINSKTGSGGLDGGTADGNVSVGGELKDLCCANRQKEMLPNTQSIEGL